MGTTVSGCPHFRIKGDKMNDTIRIKSGAIGNRNAMPSLNVDELGYRKDEKALYIGIGEKNERLCGANDVTEINTKINNIITEINDIKTAMNEINGVMANINTRLDALENPSE